MPSAYLRCPAGRSSTNSFSGTVWKETTAQFSEPTTPWCQTLDGIEKPSVHGDDDGIDRRPCRAHGFIESLEDFTLLEVHRPYPGIEIDAASTTSALPDKRSCSVDLVKNARPL